MPTTSKSGPMQRNANCIGNSGSEELLSAPTPFEGPSSDLMLDVYAVVYAEWQQHSMSADGTRAPESLPHIKAQVDAQCSDATSRRQLWWRHGRIPLIAFIVCAGVFATTSTDVAIARALFFDAANARWIGADVWWIEDVVHGGGRWIIRSVAVLACVLWMAAGHDPRLRGLRRPTAYFIVAVILSTGLVGVLKMFTNVDCPRDLYEFGGRFPFVALFADRPDTLPPGHCFPAAHAASGYALLALYFMFRERRRALAYAGFALGIAAGLAFGLAQQARGAHFASHDVWSAFLAWMIALTVYTFAFKARLWEQPCKLDPAATFTNLQRLSPYR